MGVPHRRPGGTAAEVHGRGQHGPLVVLASQVVMSPCVHQLVGKSSRRLCVSKELWQLPRRTPFEQTGSWILGGAGLTALSKPKAVDPGPPGGGVVRYVNPSSVKLRNPSKHLVDQLGPRASSLTWAQKRWR